MSPQNKKGRLIRVNRVRLGDCGEWTLWGRLSLTVLKSEWHLFRGNGVVICMQSKGIIAALLIVVLTGLGGASRERSAARHFLEVDF